MLGIKKDVISRKYNEALAIASSKGSYVVDGIKYVNAEVELEARFRDMKVFEFMRIMNKYFNDIDPIITTDYIFLDENGNSIRRTIDEEQFTEIWIRKEEQYSPPYIDYNLKIAIAIEESVDDIEIIDDYNITNNSTIFTLSTVRKKERWTKELENFSCILMITKVAQDDIIKYEIELEMLRLQYMEEEDIVLFRKALANIYKNIYDTLEIYSVGEKAELISYVNRINNHDGHLEISKDVLNEARNLKHKDLVWGGIVGNEKHTYNVTDKADGLRCMMIINEVGVWIVAPGYKYSLLKRVDWNNQDYNLYKDDLVGLICEGEDIPPENRLNENITSVSYIQFFDILSLPGGDASVRSYTHTRRRELLMRHVKNPALKSVVEDSLLTFDVKDFYILNNIREFFVKINEVLNVRRDYLTDGLVFTPEDEEYNPRIGRQNISYDKRILSNISDICKWKPKITMDLKIGKERKLYSVRGADDILFEGNKLDPFDSSNYQRVFTMKTINGNIEIDLDTLSEEIVVEFLYENGILVPMRVRYDKTTPNPSFVTDDNWKYIMDPISEETMRGESTNLMRKYHNKIKRKLFDYISATSGSTLLDIASGRGGDITKWRNFSKVVAVEPNRENLESLKNRLIISEAAEKVKVVETIGQDTDTITNAVREHIGGKADYCSVMLGFSFFWKSEEDFLALVRTIINNTKKGVIFLTIDGDSVEQAWYPSFNITRLISTLNIGRDFIDYNRDRNPPIRVNIGNIVNMQEEYLVYLGDLMRYFETSFLYRADQELFMNPAEYKLSSMYTYGYFSITGDIELPSVEKISSLPIVKDEKPEEEEKEEVVSVEFSVASSDVPSEISEIPSEQETLLEPDKIQEYLPLLPENEVVQEVKGTNLVRISSLWDLSFFDSYLKAFNTSYQENDDSKYRKDYINRFRIEIADRLYSVWGAAANGLLIERLTEELLNDEKELHFTASAMKDNLLNGIGMFDEDIAIVAKIIGVDVIVLDAYVDNMTFAFTTYGGSKTAKLVILSRIIHNDAYHYDLIGELTDSGIKTFFSARDKLITSMLEGVYIREDVTDDPIDYYRYAIISRLGRLPPLNKDGHVMFTKFRRVEHNEPYFKVLRKEYNISTKGSLAISKLKIDKHRKILGI